MALLWIYGAFWQIYGALLRRCRALSWICTAALGSGGMVRGEGCSGRRDSGGKTGFKGKGGGAGDFIADTINVVEKFDCLGSKTPCNTLHHTATYCIILHHTAPYCSTTQLEQEEGERGGGQREVHTKMYDSTHAHRPSPGCSIGLELPAPHTQCIHTLTLTGTRTHMHKRTHKHKYAHAHRHTRTVVCNPRTIPPPQQGCPS